MSSGSISINLAQSPEDIAAVKVLFLEYLEFIEDFLCQPLDFQDTKKEFASFPDVYEFILLAKLGGEPVAACGVKKFKPDIAELKRLYARATGRGHKLGERLTVAAMDEARRREFSEIYLDTDPALSHAVKIYRQLGFTDIDRYYDNPMGCSLYMKKSL
ncbi:MAG: GNAT family N-acetyltransferase [Hellea sp.]|nr:GNAT family N-acetyltransferase [Hellea sp.]